MLITRWFNMGDDWYPVAREIPATFQEQRRFYRGDLDPRSALPQASDEDVGFLLQGCCCHPSELPHV